jgi:hypothetical protein
MSEKKFFGQHRAFASFVLLLCVLGAPFGFAQTKFPNGAYSSGDFTMTFNADGTHVVSMNGDVVVKGNFVISEDKIELTDKEGQFACEGVKGKYRWTAQEKSLKFEKIEDECDGRVGALSQEWIKK